MAKPSQPHPVLTFSPPLLCFFLLLSSFLLKLEAVAVNSTSSPAGFSLKLVHRDSIFSPFFPGNLTASQWFWRQVEQSESHVQRLHSFIMGSPNVTELTDRSSSTLRPPMKFFRSIYLVHLQIGSPPPSYYYLALDTGSDLTWLQCIPCNPCHPQRNRIFNPEDSSTYHVMTCDDPLCKRPFYRCDVNNNQCVFRMSYGNGDVKGVVARESFTFLSNNRQQGVSIDDIVFGCASESTSDFFNGMSEGIFGMGGGRNSFAVQFLGNRMNNKRFSYCFVGWPDYQTRESYLRFGDDITMRDPVKTIPFVQTDFPTLYFLKLTDISIDGIRLNMPPGIFDRKPDRSGGFIIDSGSSFSHFRPDAYAIFNESLIRYFERYHLERAYPRRTNPYSPTDLCYKIPEGFEGYPYVSYHFEATELRIHPKQIFHMDNVAKYFCLAFNSNTKYNILGLMQQVNHRFTYDLGNQELAFSPEDCSAEGGH